MTKAPAPGWAEQSLAMTPRVTPTLFELDWTLRTKQQEVPAADIGGYLAAVDDIRANERITYNFGYAEKPEPAKPAAPAPAPGAGWQSSLKSFLAKAAEAGAAADSSN